MLLVPFIMLLTKSLVHKYIYYIYLFIRCSVCTEEVGTDGKIFHTVPLKDKIMSFKIGEFGCILTRRILMGVFLLILTFGVLAYKI